MSGFHDLAPDDPRALTRKYRCLNDPAWYLPRPAVDDLAWLRERCRIMIVSGRGACDLLSQDVNHDRPSWRKMLPSDVGRP